MRDLSNKNTSDIKNTIKDLKIIGNPDLWKLLCKVSSEQENFMKSTKVMNVPGGCIIQVSTNENNNIAEALTFIPHVQYKKYDDNTVKLTYSDCIESVQC